MKSRYLIQQKNGLTDSKTTLENLNLWKLLKQRNAKLIFYWKKLVENGYVVFLTLISLLLIPQLVVTGTGSTYDTIKAKIAEGNSKSSKVAIDPYTTIASNKIPEDIRAFECADRLFRNMGGC